MSGFVQLGADGRGLWRRREQTLKLRLLFPLWLGYLLCFIDRSNLSIAKLEMMPQLGLTEAQLGLAGGLFWLSYATLQVPSNHLVALTGGRRVLGAILLVTGASAALMATVQSFGALLVLRLLLGFAEAGYYPGCVLYLSHWFPTSELGHITAVFTSANQMGDFAGTISASALIVAFDGTLGLSGWRWVFILQGLPAVLMGAYLLAALPDGPAAASWIAPVWRAQLEKQRPAAPPPLLPALRATLARPVTWSLVLLRFADTALGYAVGFELATLVEEVAPPSWPLQLTGLCAALPFLLSMLASIGACPECNRSSAWLDRRALRRPDTHLHAAFGCVLFAGSLALCSGLLMLRDAALSVAAPSATGGKARLMLLLLGLAIPVHNGYHGPFWQVHHALQPAELHAVSIAFCNALGSTGGLVGPFLLGALHDTLGPACSGGGGGSGGGANASWTAGGDDCIDQWGWGVTVLASCSLWLALLALCGLWPAWARRRSRLASVR